MEWTVKDLADRAGVSSRTLRHYHRIGLLEPDRTGSNGYRYYGPEAVARLQRILLLRDTGMPLARIAAVLAADGSVEAEIASLEDQRDRLTGERETLDRRIRAVERTVRMRREGRRPPMDVMLDGFNDGFEDEVVSRWGRDAFDASHTWWHAKSVREQRDWKVRSEQLLRHWSDLHVAGHQLDSSSVQDHARTHVAWFADIPGTPTHAGDAAGSAAMICGMANLYESDPSFLPLFGDAEAARFAADALRLHVQRVWPGHTPG